MGVVAVVRDNEVVQEFSYLPECLLKDSARVLLLTSQLPMEPCIGQALQAQLDLDLQIRVLE